MTDRKTALRIGLLGTRGVPARYGGFETAVEEIGTRLAAAGHDVIVYSRDRSSNGRYRGMRSVYLPTVRTKYTETLAHGLLSVLHVLVHRCDAVIIFNAANAPAAMLLHLRRIPYAINVDGLESQRSKWGGAGRAYYRACERIAVATGDAIIADSQGIGEYYQNCYNASPVFIPYGAPAIRPSSFERLAEFGLQLRNYHLIVARFEPENNVALILRGFTQSRSQTPVVVVGSAPYNSTYTAEVREAASDERVHLIGPIWDQELLDVLYAGSKTYLHGHSVGGTNPSLLRAAGAGAPCVAFDVRFNREVLGDDAWYFDSPEALALVLEQIEAMPASAVRQRAEQGRKAVLAAYDWTDVASRYEALCDRLVEKSRSEASTN